MSACAIQLRSVWSAIPRSRASYAIEISPERARRTASERNSGGYGACGAGMWTPFLGTGIPNARLSTNWALVYSVLGIRIDWGDYAHRDCCIIDVPATHGVH